MTQPESTLTPGAPADPSAAPPPAGGSSSPPRARRRRRWVWRGAAILVVLLVGGWLLIARSPLTARLVLGTLSRILGAPVQADSVTIGLDGSVTVRGLRLLAPNLPGDAARILEVEQLQARIDLMQIFTGAAPRLVSVELDRPVVRVSQSPDDGSVNIGLLQVPDAAGGTGTLPSVIVRSGAIELGEHRAGAYQALKRIVVDGTLLPARDLSTGGYRLAVREISRTPTPRPDSGILLDGFLSDDAVELTVAGLAIADWTPASVPSSIRAVYQDLNVQGEIEAVRFRYEFAGALSASIRLRNVGVDLPIDVTDQPLGAAPAGAPGPGADAGARPQLRMSNTSGELRFTDRGFEAMLDGMLEDLPYHVTVAYDGVTLVAPFRVRFISRDFDLRENPQILRFAPPVVRARLAQFSNPTGLVSTWVEVARGEPGTDAASGSRRAGDVSVRGLLEFRQGSAAFELFPYRFYNMDGVVLFDDQSVDIIEINGNAPSGATVYATGRVFPPNDDAAIEVNVQVRDAPLDDTVTQALGKRQGIVRALLNPERHNQLVERGLILTPARAAELQNELTLARQRSDAAGVARAEQALRTPVFALGGVMNLDIAVSSPFGKDSAWTERIDITFPRISVVPEKFPLPLVGENVRVHVLDDAVRIEPLVARALAPDNLPGGEARISAEADMSRADDDANPMAPRIHVQAQEVRATDLLVFAAVRAGDGLPPDVADRLTRVFTDLGLRGTLSARVDIQPDATGALALDAAVQLPGLSAAPMVAGRPARLGLEDLRGTLTVTRTGLDAALRARAVTREGPPRDIASDLTIRAQAWFTPEARVESGKVFDADIQARGLDLAAPVEDLAGVFSADGAARIVETRNALHPTGASDAALRVIGAAPAAGGAPELRVTTVELSGARQATIDFLGGRLTFPEVSGVLTLLPGAPGELPTRLEFRGVQSELIYNDTPTGRVELDGLAPLALVTGSAPGNVVPGWEPGGQSLQARLREVKLESGLTRGFVEQRLGPRIATVFRDLNPEGVFDLTARLACAGRAATPDGVSGAEWLTTGAITPRRGSLTISGRRIGYQDSSGEIEFEPGAGWFNGISLSGAGWTLAANGSWEAPTQGATSVRGDFALQSETGLNPDLRAALPAGLLQALDALNVTFEGKLEAPRVTFSVTFPEQPGAPSLFQTAGTLRVMNLSAVAGVEVSGARGTLKFQAERARPDTDIRFDVRADLDEFRAAGVLMSNGRIWAVTGETPATILVPQIQADCHGGRLSGEAALRPRAGMLTAPREYDVNLTMSGIRFASLASDLRRKRPTSGDLAGAGGTPDDAPPNPDDSRGLLDARFGLTGLEGQPASRRGRGTWTILGGRIVSVPILVPLVRASNLQFPANEPLDFARASFFVEGTRLNFEELRIESESVALLGYGSVSWPDLNLDLRFSSRAGRRVPILSTVLESARNEIATLLVNGTLEDPVVTTRMFSGTRWLISRLIGREPTPEELRLERLERDADREQRRLRWIGPIPRAPGPSRTPGARTAEPPND